MTNYREEKEAGGPRLEATEQSTGCGIADSQFTSPLQLGAVLAGSAQCQECIVKQYFRYTVGRMETPADRPLIRRVFDEFRNSQFRFKELIVALMRNSGEAVHVASDHKTR